MSQRYSVAFAILLAAILLQAFQPVFSQRVHLKFMLRAMPDNSWSLELNRNDTYTYSHWSGFGGTYVLDSGDVVRQDGSLRLRSRLPTARELPPDTLLYLTPVSIKRSQMITTWTKLPRFSLFRKRYWVLSPKPFEQAW
ncbi:MAG: hypothetical protein AAGB22_01545, partial [Bacteroidota bacterium]